MTQNEICLSLVGDFIAWHLNRAAFVPLPRGPSLPFRARTGSEAPGYSGNRVIKKEKRKEPPSSARNSVRATDRRRRRGKPVRSVADQSPIRVRRNPLILARFLRRGEDYLKAVEGLSEENIVPYKIPVGTRENRATKVSSVRSG